MPTLADEEAQRIIDEKILEHEAAILELKARRNTHSAISKLPTELIANIFLLGKRRGQDASLSFTRDPQSRNWLNVSGVCRQWRAIVLDTPRLWCHVNLAWDAERALEVLKRAKSVPLLVRCRHYRSRFGPVAKAVMSQSVQELHIGFRSQKSLARFLELKPSGSAPALEALTLSSGPLSDPDVNPMTLPKDAFWHDMRALRALRLVNIVPSSTLPMLPCLTILRCPAPSASWLIQSLRNTPLIEEISISTPSSHFNTEMPALPQVPLPHLTSLCVETAHLGISKAFDYIDYPDSANVDFSCHLVPMSDPPDFSSVQRLCSRFSAARVRAPFMDQVRIGLSGRRFEVHLVPDAQLSARLSISLPVAHSSELCSTLSLTTTRTLLLSGFDDTSVAKWFEPFSHCQQVTTLHLTQCGGGAVRGLLMADDAQNPPFEKLESLIMNDCVFNISVWKPHQGMYDAVINVLSKRKELGIPIRELKIENCTITEGVVDDFQTHVKVNWDGIEMEEEQPEYAGDRMYGGPWPFLYGSL